MLIRRCAIVMIEPREDAAFDFSSLLAGGPGLARRRSWVAYAAHLDAPVVVDAVAREALGVIPSGDWVAPSDLDVPTPILQMLIDGGLVVTDRDDDPFRARDDNVRAAHWWPLSALAHRHGRWKDTDSVAAMEAYGLDHIAGLSNRLGAPPPAVVDRAAPQARLPLPRVTGDALDEHWARRCTCRNFDRQRSLPLQVFSLMMQRVLMAQAVLEKEGITFLKKNVASGGGLHPSGAYVLVQRVDGITPGLYHYHPLDHALEPLPMHAGALESLARQWLSGQHWFADAPVQVVLTTRFGRSFWKYRQHAKAYRALVLETGHISQAMYLSAHDLGMGAFVTAAINEQDIEAGLGLDPALEGPIAICGFGWRADRMQTTEFDPAGRLWQLD